LIRIGVLAVLAFAVVGATAADAARESTAVIRPARAIGKFTLGMTEAQVRRAAGRPTYVVPRGRLAFGQRLVEWQYGPTASYIVRLAGRPGRMRVSFVSTILRRERTSQGLGVGTPERALRRAYPTLRCGELRPIYPPGSRLGPAPYVDDNRNCTLFSARGARTIFRARVPDRGAVTRDQYLRRAVVYEVVVSTGPCRRWQPWTLTC
jgi:hypothetical protein